ncbi:hypothetical protein [Bosea sp. NBC_00550]|uniref:hypothetical protein n=1 Tax=Bosea sp. NBC_00550 TaxID=2969621 RepID=UPI00223272A2|nr:hypothetical protein [Bosea sp. NBC_00550]UZF94887.1 hypothetical protein NWE53_12325 [Bosea sp. NBC_00550]
MNESPLSPHRGRRSNGGRVSRAEGRQDLGFLVVNATQTQRYRDDGSRPRSPPLDPLRIGIDDKEGRPGGINIFGRGFGNHNQDIKMRLHLRGMNALHHVAP